MFDIMMVGSDAPAPSRLARTTCGSSRIYATSIEPKDASTFAVVEGTVFADGTRTRSIRLPPGRGVSLAKGAPITCTLASNEDVTAIVKGSLAARDARARKLPVQLARSLASVAANRAGKLSIVVPQALVKRIGRKPLMVQIAGTAWDQSGNVSASRTSVVVTAR